MMISTLWKIVKRRNSKLGGFNVTVFKLEVTRLVRNRRTMIFTVITPVLFFLIFGLNKSYANNRVGFGNVSAFIMLSMALYGAVLASTSAGATVSIERALGWSRQLRLTPLTPLAYILIKVFAGLTLGLSAIIAVYIAGILSHRPSMPLHMWIICGLAIWFGSLLFTAFGLFIGYLVPSENAMQIVGFSLMLFSFGGGLFIPLSQYSKLLRRLAEFTPLYGLNQIVHYPLVGGVFNWTWVLNLLAWLLIFVFGAVIFFKKDTKRV
jgi:ABC-2 type transport system permease protein